jgi:hypothetical protein
MNFLLSIVRGSAPVSSQGSSSARIRNNRRARKQTNMLMDRVGSMEDRD